MINHHIFAKCSPHDYSGLFLDFFCHFDQFHASAEPNMFHNRQLYPWIWQMSQLIIIYLHYWFSSLLIMLNCFRLHFVVFHVWVACPCESRPKTNLVICNKNMNIIQVLNVVIMPFSSIKCYFSTPCLFLYMDFSNHWKSNLPQFLHLIIFSWQVILSWEASIFFCLIATMKYIAIFHSPLNHTGVYFLSW